MLAHGSGLDELLFAITPVVGVWVYLKARGPKPQERESEPISRR